MSMPDSDPRENRPFASPPWLWLTGGVSAVLGMTFLLWVGLDSSESEIVRRLASTDPDRRRAAAARIADGEATHTAPLLASRLRSGSEAVAEVREAFVHALGRTGNAAYFDAIERVVRVEPDGYTRCGAWLAAARVDAARFRALADQIELRRDAWDAVGVAQGRACLGDLCDWKVLFDNAADPDAPQAYAACGALRRWLRPLLESIGRWPLDFDPPDGEIWPAEGVARVQQRCEGLDLQRLADQTTPAVDAAGKVRSNVAKLTKTRGRLARLLFGD